MYKYWLNSPTRRMLEEPLLEAKSAHIGFYKHHLDPIGAFGALLYQASQGEPQHLLNDLEIFLDVERAKLCPSPGKSAARLVWYLLQERCYQNIGVHQGLKADIDYFYKISLNNGGRLEVFEIPIVLDTSNHPQKGVIVWEQEERNPKRWAREGHPCGWQLIGAKSLGLPIFKEK